MWIERNTCHELRQHFPSQYLCFYFELSSIEPRGRALLTLNGSLKQPLSLTAAHTSARNYKYKGPIDPQIYVILFYSNKSLLPKHNLGKWTSTQNARRA